MCGRCSDHRDAIQLQSPLARRRALRVVAKEADGWQTALIVLARWAAIGAFHRTVSPWFVAPSKARRNG